jgi:acid phosphatase type 7
MDSRRAQVWAAAHSETMSITTLRDGKVLHSLTAPRRTAALGLCVLLAISSCAITGSDAATPGAADGTRVAGSEATSTPTAPLTTSASSATAGGSRGGNGMPMSAAAAPAAKPVIVTFAGDIAAGTAGTGAYRSALATGNLVRRIAPRWALLGGDNAYFSGTLAEYRAKYHPTWGSFRAISKPVPGNHEYRTRGAAGYRQYFFAGASRPYYVFSAGNRWRVYMLNCEIACSTGSAQERWLRKDLAAHPTAHVLAVVHRPRYSSGLHGNDTRVTAMWNALLSAKADVMLSGHDHDYEVFAKQDARGKARPADGIKEFVNGTGGAEMYPFGKPRPNSLKRLNRDFGVLKLSLGTASYSWQFISSGYCWTGRERAACASRTGKVLDAGTRRTNRG